MEIHWIVIETMAVIVEVSAYLFFLNNRFKSKYNSILPTFGAWTIVVLWGLLATFGRWSVLLYDIGTCILLLGYTFTMRDGTIPSRLFGVVFTYSVMYITSLAGASAAVALTQSTYQHSIETQDTSRLVAIVLIKMLQIIVFYLLSKKSFGFHGLKKRPIWVLSSIAIIVFLCAAFLLSLVIMYEFSDQASQVLVLISAGLLVVMVLIFVMYELFAREELNNLTLQTEIQRTELQSQFYREIDAMYTDMRKWRHDYKNNLIALRALVEATDTNKALAYMDKLADEPGRNSDGLQTGNLVLDAVVSSKLQLAQSYGIEISVQAVYPESCIIEDDDLCSVAGNLLDNAIEACQQMSDENGKRFIDFVLIVVGRNITLTVSNSYNGIVNFSKGRYRSTKEGSYHGLGIPLIDSVAEKYQGYVVREHKMGVFKTSVIFPLIKQGG